MNIRLFLLMVAAVAIVAVVGCSDGKLNLPLYIRAFGDSEEEERPPRSSTAKIQEESSSSSEVPPPSSSSEEPPPSSSSEEPPPSSSSEEPPPPSSSSEPPPPSSSSGRGERSSSAKLDPDGYEYEDYPPLEVGAPGVKKAVTTRYWDGCRPGCSYYGEAGIQNPLAGGAIGRACGRDGLTEIPLIYRHPRSDQWGTYYKDVPCAKESDNSWPQSTVYQDWWNANNRSSVLANSHAYTCFDMAPMKINDTLAYAFAATSYNTLACGKCARLQFNNEWTYDESPRANHRALKGKTLIVMANNTGTVAENHFDIMIPGGGLGANDCFTEQIGLPKGSLQLGHVMGGLLSECSYNQSDNPKVSDRWTLEEWQTCLRERCHRAFDGKQEYLLEGCLWHVEWFMAADNPEAEWIEMPCPQKLLDKYRSTLTPRLPNCRSTDTPPCQIDGLRTN